ncbi:Protein argonaute [Neolecta irregularis DAH-3]|uniref:Protein argonaute n=1 Tax=Neolecta irregularis (strain DAH-3) TaxID=1198029 RepID=A0A1U7LP46_NEOID|nr:Protein argonaute [Neolecta irregularis DAH-3]|eukprot:OLL24409.1 Protein argonaute [Neolecta irregularis DAH-3]
MAARSDVAALTDLCSRPNYNTTSGCPTTVFANHFRVTSFPNTILHQYEVCQPAPAFGFALTTKQVTIGKGTLKPSLSRKLWATSYVQTALGENKVIFDGRHIAWCSKKLPFGTEIALETTISGSDPKTANERDRLTVKIAYSAQVNLEFIHQFLLKRYRKDEQVLQGLTALNNLLRQTPTLKFFTMGNSKNFYKEQDAVPLTGALQAWRGIFQSLRPSQGNNIFWFSDTYLIGSLTVNVDVATTVAWQGDLSLVDLVCKHTNCRDANDLVSMGDRDRHKLQQAIKGLTFFVTHRQEQGRRKVLTIKRLMKTSSITTTFPMEKDGETKTISIQRYMKMAYNKDIRYPQLFCSFCHSSVAHI